jgi:hypothetical protein
MVLCVVLGPETGERTACVSGRHMTFIKGYKGHGSLFAQPEDAEVVLRDYVKGSLKRFAVSGDHTELAGAWGENGYIALPGAEDIKNFRVVPMVVTPDFTNEITMPEKK